MKYLLQLAFLLLSVCHVSAQKQGNIWYFGEFAGLDFNSGKPVVLKNSKMHAPEGSASISNAQGQLLFYTDGITVWNRKHEIMKDGTGLLGHPSSTQSGVIVPFPADTNKYYIFTVDFGGQPNGFRYSLVDMSTENGDGSIVKKNELLVTPVAEKITAVRHKNGRDIWVIVHKWSSRNFLSFLVTPAGIEAPVVSTTGVFHGSGEINAIGNLKASPDGRRIAYVSYIPDADCQVFDFDNATGAISNPLTLTNIKYAYGLEFSPSGKLLYTASTSERKVYQYNLELGDSASINTSRVTLYEPGEYYHTFASAQLAPDGKIYIACANTNNLSIVNKPDEQGANCNFQVLGIDVKNKVTLGLPTFIQSYFSIQASFTFTGTCLGQATSFNGYSSSPVEKWLWNFDDVASGANNTSESKDPVHVFSSAGTYAVKLIVTTKQASDTIIKVVKIYENVQPALGTDIITCDTASITLHGGVAATKYLWSTGDTTSTITIRKTGKYWLRAEANGCAGSDTINITYITPEDFTLGNDTVFCEGAEVELSCKIDAGEYTWSTGSKNKSIIIKESGKYWLRTKAGSCEGTDTIIIGILPRPVITLGSDTMLCEGDTMSLDAKNQGAEYLWSTGENTQEIVIRSAGKYWLEVTAGECKATDTIVIKSCPPVIYVPNAFTPNNDNINDVFSIQASDIYQSELKVYNRWGECVFVSNDIKTGWDGKFRQASSPVDIYFWMLRYKGADLPNADVKEMKGTVRLIR